MHAAQQAGLLHRDIKPSNILLDHDDFAYLIDFGIARAADETRMTKSGNTIGTFAYIAPERLDSRAEEDARADIYSLAKGRSAHQRRSYLLRDSEGLPAAARPAIRQSLIAYAKDVVDDEFPRMRRGEAVEQESEHLTQIWQSFLQVEPVSQREISFYRESITRIDDLGNARKTRISSSQSEIPTEMWVLLLGGGVVMLLFTYLFATPELVLHGVFIALAGALLAFVLYLIFAMEHPFVGSISVGPDPFVHVLDTWSQPAPK